jgi:hypothetical protein
MKAPFYARKIKIPTFGEAVPILLVWTEWVPDPFWGL